MHRLVVAGAAFCFLACGRVERDPAGGAEARPGSAWLAYSVRSEDAASPTDTDLFITRPGSGITVAIHEGAGSVGAVAWSPAEALLAVVGAPGSEWVLEILELSAQGIESRRTLDTAPAHLSGLKWSPDGRWLAYRLAPEGGAAEIRVVDVRSTEPPITIWSGFPRDAVWSTSGDALAVQVDLIENSELYIARPDDDFVPRIVPLPESVWKPELGYLTDHASGSEHAGWSPTGQFLAFYAREKQSPDDHGDRRAYVTDERATQTTLVTPRQNDEHASANNVEWSPDESVITYEDNTSVTEPPPPRARFAVAFESGVAGEPVEIGRSAMWTFWASGDALFAVERKTGQPIRAMLRDLGALPEVSDVELFTFDGKCADPIAHAEPLNVVLRCEREGSPEQAVVAWDASRVAPYELLAADAIRLYEHAWSPAGEMLAFLADGSLYEARFPEGATTPIASGVRRWSSSNADTPLPWSPDGDAYFFTSEDGALEVRVVGEEGPIAIAGGGSRMAEGIAWQRGGLHAQ